MTDMTTAERAVLWCLFLHGPTWDGDIPSKTGRDSLIDRGLATRENGWTTLTAQGLSVALASGLGEKKDAWRRQHSSSAKDEALREAEPFLSYLAGESLTFVGSGMPADALRKVRGALGGLSVVGASND